MIVTCERCETQFQLDDTRIPPDGVRVRCSRCKHAFQVTRSQGRSLADAQAPSPPVAGGEAEDEESDWQFNEDLPSQDPEASGRFLAGLSAEARGDPSADAELDWDADPGPSEPAPMPAVEEDASEEGLSESGLDLLERMERSTPARPAARREGASAFPVAEVGVGRDTPAAPLPRAASEIAAEADAAAQDETAGPDDWNLFDDDEAGEGGKPRKLPPVVPGALRREDDTSSARWLQWLSDSSHYVGGALVAGLFLYGLAGIWSTPEPVGAPPRASVTDGFEVAGASGRWVENAVQGPLYVVSGSLWNAGPGSAPPPPLQVEWLDREGQVLERSAARATAPRRRETLREAAPADLAGGASLDAGGRLPPGAGLPFEVVVTTVPDAAAHFRVVATPAPAARRARPGRAPGTRDVPVAGAEVPATAALPQPAEDGPEAEPSTAAATPSEGADPAGGQDDVPAAPAP